MDILELFEQMGLPVRILMGILAIMSMWSMGVFFERLFTFTQAGKQSKMFAPQAAKHLRDGRLKDAIAISQSKNYKYSHLGKVVLAGLQEYQFQKESGVELARDDLVDAVRRSIQRASALTAADLKKGMGSLATIGATAVFVGLLATTLGVINAFRGSRPPGRAAWARCRPVSPRRSLGPRSGCSWRFRGVVLQLSDRADRVLQRRDG